MSPRLPCPGLRIAGWCTGGEVALNLVNSSLIFWELLALAIVRFSCSKFFVLAARLVVRVNRDEVGAARRILDERRSGGENDRGE